MHGAIAAVALRNATMEMNRDKHRMRHLKSNKTIRMSFASTRSLAVGSVRALYGVAMTKVDRLLRKDRFKNEVHYTHTFLPFEYAHGLERWWCLVVNSSCSVSIETWTWMLREPKLATSSSISTMRQVQGINFLTHNLN